MANAPKSDQGVLDKLKNVFCGNKRYKGHKYPTCNNGNPCQTCLATYSEQHECDMVSIRLMTEPPKPRPLDNVLLRDPNQDTYEHLDKILKGLDRLEQLLNTIESIASLEQRISDLERNVSRVRRNCKDCVEAQRYDYD